MSNPIEAVLYVAVANDNASGPGASQRLVKLLPVKGTPAVGTTPAVAGPNDALFDNPQTGGITLDITGATDAMKSQFKGGKKWSMTLVPFSEES